MNERNPVPPLVLVPDPFPGRRLGFSGRSGNGVVRS